LTYQQVFESKKALKQKHYKSEMIRSSLPWDVMEHYISKERRPHLHSSESLKLRTEITCFGVRGDGFSP
jgi:hypothetical protein